MTHQATWSVGQVYPWQPAPLAAAAFHVARDGALVRQRAGRRRPSEGAVPSAEEHRRRYGRQKGIFTQSTAHQYRKQKLSECAETRQELFIPTREPPFEKVSLNYS